MCLQSHQLKRIGFPRCGSGDFLGFLSNTVTLAAKGHFNKHLYCSFMLEYAIKRGKNTHIPNLPLGKPPEICEESKQIPPSQPKSTAVLCPVWEQHW